VLKSGAAQEVTLKVLNKNGHTRVFMERAGRDYGSQKMMFEIESGGEKACIVQTARDDYGNLIHQRPGEAKNNLFDIKKWLR